MSFFIVIYCFLIIVQLIFILLLLIAFEKKRGASVSITSSPPISIIVCAHNEEPNLRKLVPLLLRQDYSCFEIIVIDDTSNDFTYDYLLQTAQLFPQLKIVRVVDKPDHIKGKKYGLTLGIRKAKYDWILLTDADCRPFSSKWIKGMTQVIRPSTQIVLGFSSYEKTKGLLNTFIRFESFLTSIQYIGMTILGVPYMGVGRNLLYQKSLFLKNKGFNSHLSVVGGDDDLFVNENATSKNTTVRIGKETLTLSKPKISWREYYQQKIRHLSVGKHYHFKHKFMIGSFSISWVLIYFLFIPLYLFDTHADEKLIIATLLIVRIFLLSILFYRASRKMGDPFNVVLVPILDFLYTIYYPIVGIRALTARKIIWKN